MRNLPRRIFTAVAYLLLIVLVGVAAMPAASAQSTETTEVLDSGETLIINTLITNGGDRTVAVERLISADGCSEKVTTTTTSLVSDTEPVIPTQEYENRGNASPVVRPTLVTDVVEEENALVCSPPLSLDDPDEVLGETILAVTGSDIDLPIAVGAALIGSGGLLVAASKRRRSRRS